MLKAKPTWQGRLFWETFSAIATRVCFKDFIFEKTLDIAQNKAILVIGNHISWWDGFWPLLLNKRYFHKKYYVMMLEDELRQRPFMRQGGSFSINPGNRSMVESIQYTAGLLENPANMVLMYPQGKIHSIYDTDFQFQPGLDKIHQKCKADFQTIFFAAMLDYGSFALPTLRLYLGEYQGDFSAGKVQEAYQKFYLIALETQLKEPPGER